MRRRSFSAALVALMVFMSVVAVGGRALAQFDAKSVIVNANPSFSASIWTDRSNYNPGDRLTAYCRVSRDAYIYVFDVDTTGSVSLIYPNIYSDNNYKRASTTYTLPDNARYNLTIGGPSGTEQLIMLATPSKIKDVEWIRRSLEQGTFGPQLNVNITAERFMLEIKSVTVTPNFGSDWASASTTFTVGGSSAWPVVTPPAPQPVVRYGTLHVTSQPSGATVFVDGVQQGSTPITVSGVAMGTHEITVVKKDYYTYSTQVSVTGTGTYPIHAVLAKAPGNPSNYQEVALVSKAFTVKWPNSGPFRENFTYRGSSGSVTVSGDPLLGMLTRVTASMTCGGVGPVQFAEIAPSGPDAPWPGRVYEKVQYPFRARLIVEDYKTTSGAIFGLEYLESIRLRLDVWYIGN